MPERTTITQITQVGVETNPGTAVAATKLFQALSIEPAVKADITTVRPLGFKYPTIAALGKEWVEARITGDVACYNHLAYLFSGVLAYAAPTHLNDDAVLWTFRPARSSEDPIKTYTVEQGSGVRAGRFTYGLITELTLSFSREKIEVSGSMLGQAYQDGIQMTASPQAISVQPVLPTDMDVYLDESGATIGTTKLLRVLSGEFTISDRFGPLWTINSAVDGFAAHVELAPTAQLKLLVEADAAGMALLTAMRTGDKRYIRLQVIGPEIAGDEYYTLEMDLCGVVNSVGEFSDEDGVYAIEWTFDVAYDQGWDGGKAMEVRLVNIQGAL